jgi:hypothetical protein
MPSVHQSLFSPIIYAKMLAQNPGYRKKFSNWGEEIDGGEMMPCQDRPLIVQLCGSFRFRRSDAVYKLDIPLLVQPSPM